MPDELHAEIGFDANIGDKFPKWYDVSPYVISGSAKRGRNGELDRIDTGEGSLLLDNSSGLFTPGRTTLNVLAERFTSFGTAGSGNTFTVDSGTWQYSGSGNTNNSITSGVDGITATSTLAAAGYIDILTRFDSGYKSIPVKPGDTVTITYKARAVGGATATNINAIPFWAQADGTLINWTTASAAVSTNGATVTKVDTFTVPANAYWMRPLFRASQSGAAGTSHSLTLSYVKVDVPHPYAGKIEPGKPFRKYVVTDDNWVHYEAVNASTVDADAPRWHSWEYADSTGVTVVTDSTLNRPVFEFAKTVTYPSYAWFTGIKDDCDFIPVKSGQTVDVSGTICNVSNGQTAPGVYLTIEHSVDGKTFTDLQWGTQYNDLGVWHSATVTGVAPSDGYVRCGVYTKATAGTMRARGADFKVRLNGNGTGAVGAMSGRFPIFRGATDAWTQEFNGRLSTTEVECVDGLAIVSQPLDVPYRTGVVGWYRTNGAPGKFWYWPCVEEDTSLSAGPLIGTDRLNVAQGAANPGAETAFGFTDTKTMPNADGEGSGGYTIHIDPGQPDILLNAGPLVFVQNKYPANIGAGFTSIDADVWFVADSLPPMNGANARDSYVFTAYGYQDTAISFNSNGALVFNFLGQFGYAYKTADNVVSVGVPIHVGLRGTIDTTARTCTIYGYVNGVQVVTATNPLPASFTSNPQFDSVYFGCRLGGYYGGGWQYNLPMRGTFNHCVLALDVPVGLHSAVHVAGGEAAEVETARIGRLLDVTGFPGPRLLDVPKSTLLPSNWDKDTDGQELLTDAAESAGGTVFVGPAGEAVYHNRHRRIGLPARWTVRDWTDGLRFTLDASRVFNVVRAERASGSYRTATDETSVKKNGAKPKTINRDVVDDNELSDAAYWFLGRHASASPRSDTLRIEAHTLTSATDAPLRALAYAATPSDRLLMTDLPPTAPSDEYDVFIEGTEMSFTVDGSVVTWVTSLTVSAADKSLAFVLDDATSGVLDNSSAVLIY